MSSAHRPAAPETPSRRMVLGALAAGAGAGVLHLFPREARADVVRGPARPEDEGLMREAIAVAAESDFPFGTVIARNGEVLVRGPNLGRRLADPTAHGEMVAIRRFLAARPADELKGTTLYTSGEPCPMCMGAILWCGIPRVVYAASISEIAEKYGRANRIDMPALSVAQQMVEAAPFLKVELTAGVLSQEALALFDHRK